MIGRKFGKWTVQAEGDPYVSPRGEKHKRWLCKCECSLQRLVRGTYLRTGQSASCGLKTCRGYGTPKHGLSKHPVYHVWKGITQRCTNKNNKNYKHYGGRGIKVCKRWEKFENFYEDMGEKLTGLSLDRIDNNGDYSPTNCKWSTRAEQSRNKRNNKLLTYKGKTQCLVDWAKDLGIKISTLRGRLNKGWSIEKAITTPVKGFESLLRNF